jgi:leader peptidase (prepilin peptidase)/N-methyltransferase
VQLIVAIPMEVRLAALSVLGVCIGSLLNLGIYRLAWHPRAISPWSWPDAKAPPRRLWDRLPVVGWLGLRREAALHGSGFWIRPMLVELLTGVGLAVLYWWEIDQQGLLPPDAPQLTARPLQAVLHAQYAAHALLMALMLVASMIDVDEKTIPDTVTVPGTLLGLVLAVVYPWSLLPEFVAPLDGRLRPHYWRLLSADTWQILQPASPELAPMGPLGFMPHLSPQGIRSLPEAWLLAVGLGCWWLWCVGLMPRSWYSRHGYRRALQLSVARLVREPATYRILVMGAIGSAAVVAVWLAGGRGWTGLMSGLVGMAAGGGLIWLVRVIGTAALKREAMGFGDVTLMAMVGAFLGWQTCLIVFFIAPFAGVIVGLLQVILVRDSRIPYGPFLCLAAGVAIVYWAAIWNRTWDIFAMGWLVPLLILVCLALMALMLGLWRSIRDALR